MVTWPLPPQRRWGGNLEDGAEPVALAEVSKDVMPSLGRGSRSPSAFSVTVKSWPLNRVTREDPPQISPPKPRVGVSQD